MGSTKEANSEASHVLPPRRQNTSLARFLNTGVRQQRTVREEPQEVSKVGQGNGLSDKFNDVAIHQATESCIQISEFNTLQSDPSLPTPLQTGTSVSPHIVVTAPVTSTPNNSPPYENLLEIVASKQKALITGKIVRLILQTIRPLPLLSQFGGRGLLHLVTKVGLGHHFLAFRRLV